VFETTLACSSKTFSLFQTIIPENNYTRKNIKSIKRNHLLHQKSLHKKSLHKKITSSKITSSKINSSKINSSKIINMIEK
jgi:hypothetical protein